VSAILDPALILPAPVQSVAPSASAVAPTALVSASKLLKAVVPVQHLTIAVSLARRLAIVLPTRCARSIRAVVQQGRVR